MLSEETHVPRSVVFSDADRCAQAIVDSVGNDLRLAVPMSIGKPILIVDALYRLAEADRRVQLTIFTGLTLTLPRPRIVTMAAIASASAEKFRQLGWCENGEAPLEATNSCRPAADAARPR